MGNDRYGRRVLRQGGFTFWTLLVNGLLLAMFLVLVLRILPNYMAYMTVRDVVTRAADSYQPRKQTLQDLRTSLRKLLTTSQVYEIKAEDMKIYREDGKVYIDARYEARFPVFWIIDGVMKFDDLVVEAGTKAER